jgi:hypothetical protein
MPFDRRGGLDVAIDRMVLDIGAAVADRKCLIRRLFSDVVDAMSRGIRDNSVYS